MLARCSNPKRAEYKRYGGRGIRVCSRWRRSFARFDKDMGPRPAGCTLERINGNGNYEPGNVKWAGSREQANNRSTSKRITHNGITLTAAEWGRLTGIPRQQIANRINRGWSPRDALETPYFSKIASAIAMEAA